MNTIESNDGTRIAYDRSGDGPAVILVTGALEDRATAATLAAPLASRFTVFAYDRRGRGDSGDTPPYAVAREIEDLEGLIREAGGSAYVFGHSSGAALAFEATLRGLPISKLALYEPPYIVNGSRPPVPEDYVPSLNRLIAEGRRADAVEYFWEAGLRLPSEAIAQMRSRPSMAGFEAMAHTIAYDGEVMGDRMAGRPLPADWARVEIPTLVIEGGASPASLRDAAAALTALLPNARCVTLEGHGHNAPPAVLAPILERFFLA